MKSLLLLLFCLLSISSFGNPNLEEIYLEIRCKNLKNSFFQARFDYEKEKLYIGAMNLFYFLEIYDVDVDLNEKTISFTSDLKTYKAKLDNAIVEDEELYIPIEDYKKFLSFKNMEFNYDYLRLNIDTDFILPYEEREKAKIARLRLDNQKEEEDKNLIKMPRRIISPGFLKLKYGKYNITKKSKENIRYEYGNQFLYGSLYLEGSLNEKDKISYGKLKYSNFWKKKDLTLGNIYMDGPSFLSIREAVIGVSLKDSYIHSYRDGAMTIIRGEAINAETIELYRGSFLIDYIHPRSNNYEFRIDDGNIGSEYTVKIYYEDGKIEKKTIYNISETNMLKKGKIKWEFEGGKEEKSGNPQMTIGSYYGINNNLTLYGGFDYITSQNKIYNFVKSGFIMNTRQKIMPTLINYKSYYDVKDKSNNYNLKIAQNFKDYRINYNRERYSNYFYQLNNLKKYENISFGHEIYDNYFEFGYEINHRKKKDRSKYLYWSNSYLSPFSYSVKIQKSKNYYNINPTISYFGDMNAIFQGNFRHDTLTKKWDNYYTLKFTKRNIKFITDKVGVDTGAFIRYTEHNHDLSFGINFSFKFDNYIYFNMENDISKDNQKRREYSNNIEIDKMIDLSHPLANIKNDDSVENAIIYGKVYMDNNCNEKFDDGDEIVQNAIIKADYTKTKSNDNGDYILPSVQGNTKVKLEVDRKSIDPMYKAVYDDILIQTIDSGRMRLNIPIQRIAIVTGNIISHGNIKKFSRNISLILVELIKNNEVIAETKPEFDGMYYFEDILPGKYEIRFKYLGKENLKFNKKILDLDISKDDMTGYFEGYNVIILDD